MGFFILYGMFPTLKVLQVTPRPSSDAGGNWNSGKQKGRQREHMQPFAN
jgi:hypothetical protein